MSIYKVYTDTDRQKFWQEEAEISNFCGSEKYISAVEAETRYTFDKNCFPYTKTIGKSIPGGIEFQITANGKSVTVTVKDSQNENLVISKAVAKCFKI